MTCSHSPHRWLAIGLALAVGAPAAAAVQRQTVVTAEVTGVYQYQYLLYTPPGFGADPSGAWPLLIFLHGSGQSGSNIDLVAAAGPPLLIEQGVAFPCVVVSPQAKYMNWDPAALEAFIQDRVAQYHIDPNRIYVTGLSMGGYGTWALAQRKPDYYAAVMPLCGGGDPSQAYKMRDLPLWAFHGSLDTTVPVARTQEMIDGIRRAGGNPLLTLYPDLGHDVWTVTYANDAIYTWLFAQNRVRAPSPPLVGTQPAAQTAASGRNAVFSVAAGGIPPPAYQWQRLPSGSATWENLREGGSYQGVTTATLTAVGVTAGMSGDQFRCVITNASGDVTSSAVALTVSGGVTATLQYPAGLALDNAGNLYVADAFSNTIRKITPAGSVSTLAGSSGVAGAADGTGTAARFNQPSAVAVDAAGNVFVADTGNSLVRKITASGVVTTLAGSSTARGSADGTGSAALFNAPAGIAVDATGTVYVADTFNATIRRINAVGAVSTAAGSATIRGEADGSGDLARFNHPNGLAVDLTGNIYVADTYNDTIRRIGPDGMVTTLAGAAGISGAVDLTGINALFNQPTGVTVDAMGNVYVADAANSTIRKISASGAVTSIAGIAGVAGLANGTGGNALFNQPHSLVVDGAGNLYVADTGNAVVRKVAFNGTVTTLALTEAATPATGGTTPSPGGSTPGTTDPGTSSGGSSGGGALGTWFAGVLALLGLLRLIVGARLAAASGP